MPLDFLRTQMAPLFVKEATSVERRLSEKLSLVVVVTPREEEHMKEEEGNRARENISNLDILGTCWSSFLSCSHCLPSLI